MSSTVTSRGAVGLFTSLYFDETNTANIVYYNRRSDGVFHIKGTPPTNWTAQTLRLGGGTNAVASATVDQTAAAYAWYDPAKVKLMTGDIL